MLPVPLSVPGNAASALRGGTSLKNANLYADAGNE